ncbi:MAG TPA: GDSL-type esterase/lipase family protein [Opitutaceae bacterium]|nr:GDSL-type esterase/lipase family protein [Opitutaceae bacterium]
MYSPAFIRRLTALSLLGSLALGVPSGRAADAAAAALVPAPVPAAVAISRPTPAEVAVVTDNLQRFLAQADLATKAILAKYPDMLAVRPPRANPGLLPILNPDFRAKHEANLARAKQGDVDLLFMGDSITDLWRNAGPAGVVNPPFSGKAVFDKYYGAMKTANFGIGGDTTQGVLYRLRHGEGEGFQPKAIMLLIGTNNVIFGSPSAEIAEAVGAVVLELRRHFPAAKILLLGIFPRANPGDDIRKTVLDANAIIAKLHDGKNVFYLDIGAKLLDADGQIPPDIMSDKLHPTEKGYEIWAAAVKEPLAELMK